MSDILTGLSRLSSLLAVSVQALQVSCRHISHLTAVTSLENLVRRQTPHTPPLSSEAFRPGLSSVSASSSARARTCLM